MYKMKWLKELFHKSLEEKIDPLEGRGPVDEGRLRLLDDNPVDDYLYCKVVIDLEKWLLHRGEKDEAYRLCLLMLRKLVEEGPLATRDHQRGKRYR